jgi:hypothetical protein
MVVATRAVNAKDDDDGRRDGERDSYTIGLFGDMPYNALGKSQYPALLADINRSHVAFSVFDGDLKAGGDGMCTNDLYTRSLAYFNSLRAPLIFTPGDNDWTDCWGRYGPGTGGFDPEERLAYERQLYFSTPRSLGSGRSGCSGSRTSQARTRPTPRTLAGGRVQSSSSP